jgi:hypothetical protein
MKNNTFIIPAINGSKRVSPREYTHAIIGRPNWERLAEQWKPSAVEGSGVLNSGVFYSKYLEAAKTPVSERPFEVLQWSQSLRAAQAKLGYWSKFNLNVQIVEVVKK